MSETRSPSKSFSWASGNAFCPFLVSKRSKREEGGKKKNRSFSLFFFLRWTVGFFECTVMFRNYKQTFLLQRGSS